MTIQLPSSRSETAFEDFKLPLLRGEAIAEATRCLFCHDAPCIQACPTEIDIPQFIRKIASDNVRGSAKTIFESNILGMSCARVCPVEVLCVGACVYNQVDQPPIAIGKLQRYATDRAYEEGWEFFTAGASTGKRVALIGAGPASLAAAHELRRFGHACTIFEQRTTIGGLNTTGVAPYKMKADRALTEVEWVLSIGGIEVKTGVTVGVDISLADLDSAFDAVFVGVGLGEDSSLGIAGEQLDGVHGAVAWIEQMKLRSLDLSKIQRAVVIGGGNTALDAAREVKGLGIPWVTLLYRGTREVMKGYAHEFDAAMREGVRVEWQCNAREISGNPFAADPSRLYIVACGQFEDHRVPNLRERYLEVEADLVLVAVGQSKLTTMFTGFEGIEFEEGRLRVDAVGFTGRPRWFAGGDCTNAGKEVVNAVAEGKRAAHAIHAALQGGIHHG